MCVLDIESQRLIEDWNRPWEGGLSVAGIWVSWAGGSMGEFRLYQQDESQGLADVLEYADLVVGKNSEGYDIPAIEGLLKRPLRLQAHCDLQALTTRALGYRVSLDALAWATLRRAKDGFGAMAPVLWKDGRMARLHTYNMRDLALTRDLFFFARDYGYLLVEVDGECRRLPIEVPGGVTAWVPVAKEQKRPSFEPATPKQIQFIRQLWRTRGVSDWEPVTPLTKSEASGMIQQMQSAEVGH